MTNDWILDVIADLRAFAGKNGLSKLADHLETASEIALIEIASNDTGEKRSPMNGRISGVLYRPYAER